MHLNKQNRKLENQKWSASPFGQATDDLFDWRLPNNAILVTNCAVE